MKTNSPSKYEGTEVGGLEEGGNDGQRMTPMSPHTRASNVGCLNLAAATSGSDLWPREPAEDFESGITFPLR